MKTRSKYLKLIFVAFVALVACNSKNTKQAELLKLGIHSVIVQEIIQTSQYTYLRLIEFGNPKVNESDTIWCAVTSMESSKGDTLYYKGGFPMKNFESKELKRTFKEVLFLDDLSKTDDFVKKEMAAQPSHQQMSSDSTSGKPQISKIEVKIDPIAGGITIADLYAKKASYSGKTIKVKGKVTKFSPEIMGKNWIHLQDGTESNGKYDLTITTDLTVNVGDIIVLEGKITLDKDLGYSYFYEVLMEDAKKVK